MTQEVPQSAALPLTVSEMTELAGGLAHELRNPLSTMMINLKLLGEDLQDRDSTSDDIRRRALLKVDVLRREAERLQLLFDDFLNLTSPYRLELEDHDLKAIVFRLVEFLEPMLRAGGVAVTIARSESPVQCRVDEKLISQALLNLVMNARDAMPGGGTVTIGVRVEADNAILSVADTGIGIDPKNRDRILRPFFSTKAKGGGLGLSITRRIIQEHGGDLSFTSQPGAGTEFVARLPIKAR